MRQVKMFGIFVCSATLLLLVPSRLQAGPVLLCDPYPVTEVQPTAFVVVLDGAIRNVPPERYPDGSSRLHLDLGQIADGVHTVKVKAINSAVNSDSKSPRESAWVSLSFRKTGSQIVRLKEESEKRSPSRTYKGYLKDEH